ncbi:MAG: hemolysin III family protein, partial [Phycisphaerae bacterium]|nr:hemolysin III family protein [Phycisphaerae bacterium]
GGCLIGIALKVFRGTRHPALSLTLYVAAGWLILIAAKPMLELLPGWGLFWLLAGGLAYTGGIGFYITDHRIRYGHFLWHLCVLAGTSCHFIAVVRYAAA